MLKTENENRIIATSLIQFKPRQVMLLAQQKTMKHHHTKTPEQKKTLLHLSLCRYLHVNGFSKTLKKFLSEANLHQDDSWKDCTLDLEQMYYNGLETGSQFNTNSDGYKNQDLQRDDISRKDEVSYCITSVETVNRKKKKKSDKSDCNAVDNQFPAKDQFSNVKKSEEMVTGDLVPEISVKSKMDKKMKSISGSIKEVAEQVRSDVLTESANGNVNEPQMDELNNKRKDKKKSEGKSGYKSLVDTVDDYQKETQPAENKGVKSKGKKKRKNGLVLDDVPIKSKDELDKGKSRNNSQEDDFQTSENVAISKENKDSKKRKRLVSKDNNAQPIDKVVIEKCKRRKTEGMEESQPNMQLKELDASLENDGHAGKGKEQNGKVCLNNTQERAITQVDTHANGNLERYEENLSVQKSSKKQHNGSVEPKTVNAFQRVKIDKVVFTDERLQDNSYWAKDGAEIGYGAKAQEVLGQVRGRDFRHEKTKKKRGSYRGGQIDLHSHSIKFNYSDDD